MPLHIPIEKFSSASDDCSEDEKYTSESIRSSDNKSTTSNKSHLAVHEVTQKPLTCVSSNSNINSNQSGRKVVPRSKIVKNSHLMSVSGRKRVLKPKRNNSARKRVMSVSKFDANKATRKNVTSSNLKGGYYGLLWQFIFSLHMICDIG